MPPSISVRLAGSFKIQVSLAECRSPPANESYKIWMFVTQIWMSHLWHDCHTYLDESFVRVTWLIHIRAKSHSYQKRAYILCCRAPWLIHVTHMNESNWVSHETCLHPLLSHTALTHSCVWQLDSFMCVRWLIHVCDNTHSYVWHDSIYRSDVTHSFLVACGHMWVTRLTRMRDTTDLCRPKNIGLFCKIDPQKRPISCKRDLYSGAY